MKDNFGFGLKSKRENDLDKSEILRDSLMTWIKKVSISTGEPIIGQYQAGVNASTRLSVQEKKTNNTRSMREKEHVYKSMGHGITLNNLKRGTLLVQPRFVDDLEVDSSKAYLKAFGGNDLDEMLLHYAPQYFLFIGQSKEASAHSHIFYPLAYLLVPISSIPKDSWKNSGENKFTSSALFTLKRIKDDGKEMIQDILNNMRR